MYAIIQSGSKQYRVEPGACIEVELLGKENGEKVTFEEICFLHDGKKPHIGKPSVTGFVVTGEVLGEAKGPKIRSLKFKRRHIHNTKFGHRQRYSRVKITGIAPSKEK